MSDSNPLDTPPRSPHEPNHPLEPLEHHLLDLKSQFAELHGHLGLRLRTAELKSLYFNGGAGQVEQVDDLGLEHALSYGIYNPLAVKAYLAITGGSANAGAGALAIPKEAALILPVAVAGQLRVGVDAGELGAESGLLWRLKFATPQPFYLGGL